jgi:hypothetical protein
LQGTNVELRRACGREDSFPQSHQDRLDDAQLRRVDSASEGGLVARVRHGGGDGRSTATAAIKRWKFSRVLGFIAGPPDAQSDRIMLHKQY